jgi:hypothetical protein
MAERKDPIAMVISEPRPAVPANGPGLESARHGRAGLARARASGGSLAGHVGACDVGPHPDRRAKAEIQSTQPPRTRSDRPIGAGPLAAFDISGRYASRDATLLGCPFTVVLPNVRLLLLAREVAALDKEHWGMPLYERARCAQDSALPVDHLALKARIA